MYPVEGNLPTGQLALAKAALGPPELVQRNLQFREWWKLHDIGARAANPPYVFATAEAVGFDGALCGIDDPVILHLASSVLLELLLTISAAAAGTDHFDTQIGRTFDRLITDQTPTIVDKVKKIGPADIMLAKDRVNIQEQYAQSVTTNVGVEYGREFCDNTRVLGNWTWTHCNLSINELQPHARRIFPQLEELASRHLDRAYARHTDIIATLCHLMRRLRQVVVDGLLLGLIAGEGEEDHVVVDLGLEMHGAVPEFVDVFERLDRRFDLDVQPVVLVGHVKLAAVAIVAIDDVDVGLAHVGELIEKSLFDALWVAGDDAELAGVRVAAVLIEAVFFDEFLGHELVDEIDVVVDAADLEDFGAALAEAFVPAFFLAEVVGFFVFLAEFALVPAVFDVAKHFQADFVGVEVAGGHVDGAGVVVGVVDYFAGLHKVLGHERGVPVAGPAFV